MTSPRHYSWWPGPLTRDSWRTITWPSLPLRWAIIAWKDAHRRISHDHIPTSTFSHTGQTHPLLTTPGLRDDTRFETLQRPDQISDRPSRYDTKCTPIDMATQAAGRPISVTSSRNSTCLARCPPSSFGPGTDRSIRRELKSDRSRFHSVADPISGVP